ncbi:MAG: hypothetical protein U0031_21335, partial [Thermomicrobiales bacterium]
MTRPKQDKVVLTADERAQLETFTGKGIAAARELKMDLRRYADVVLAPGMAFSLEPDLEIPGIGTFRHCNTI